MSGSGVLSPLSYKRRQDMSEKMKDVWLRALKTFWQAALGYLLAEGLVDAQSAGAEGK